MEPKRTMHVISHTHWDREWYQTREQLRFRLVDLVDNVLRILGEDPDFRAFHLDGQTIALEDYLEVRPERAAEIRGHIESGRLLLGPWHVLNDLFLTSGEATVRNLQLGMRLAESWGPCMGIGYLPDQFGNIGQMPQILRGVGIGNAIFGRGLAFQPERPLEFHWESPDGSRVLASYMAFWYNNAQRFPAEAQAALAYTERARDQLAPRCPSGHLLLMNGVDHLEAQDDLSEVLAKVRPLLPESEELTHSTLPDYIAGVEAFYTERGEEGAPWVHTGELREDNGNQVLAGTLSARMYLKQWNDLCQRKLERIAEPLAAAASLLGATWPEALLELAWRRLIENHPHDSICGCSTDDTHADMEPRFRAAEQLADGIATRALLALEGAVDTSDLPGDATPVLLVNTLPWERTDPVSLTVDLPQAGAPEWVRLETPEGAPIAHTVLERTDLVRRDLSPVELPKAVPVRRFRLGVVAREVPAGGASLIAVRPSVSPPASQGVVARGMVLENEYLRVRVEANGSLTIDDFVSGARYTDLLTFEDGGDAGDEYTYRAPVPDRTVTTASWQPTVTVLESGATRGAIEIAGEWLLPRDSQPGGRSEESVVCEIRSVVSLAAGVPRVEVETTVLNRAKGHRLRAVFPSDIASDRLLTEGQFDLVSRPSRPPKEWAHASTTQPMQGFCALEDGHRGLAIVSEGMPEVELLDDTRRTVALTLMRCVGVLSGGGEAQGIYDWTPGAEMLGSWTFRFGIAPYAGGVLDGGAARQAHQQRVPLQAVQGGLHGGMPVGELAGLSLEPDCLIPTATERSRDGGSIVVRFFHAGASETEAVIRTAWPVAEAWLADLRERPTETLVPETDGTLRFAVAPRRIVTVLLRPAAEEAPA